MKANNDWIGPSGSSEDIDPARPEWINAEEIEPDGQQLTWQPSAAVTADRQRANRRNWPTYTGDHP